MTDCLFCKIVDKRVAAEIVSEDADTITVLDIHPMAPGHVMVLPKIHAENILDLPADKVGPVFLSVRMMTGKLKKALNPHGFTIGINHGRVSGQAIDHLHVHIIPRFDGDGGKSLHAVVNNPPRQSLKEIKEKIIKA